MFLQENQYQLARKLNRKKFLGRKRDERGRVGGGGGGGLFIKHNLVKIRRWCSKYIRRNSHKTFWDGIVI